MAKEATAGCGRSAEVRVVVVAVAVAVVVAGPLADAVCALLRIQSTRPRIRFRKSEYILVAVETVRGVFGAVSRYALCAWHWTDPRVCFAVIPRAVNSRAVGGSIPLFDVEFVEGRGSTFIPLV